MKSIMNILWLFLIKKRNIESYIYINIDSIRMMNSQRSDVGKINLIEEGKKIGINEVIRRNEIINNSLK